MTNIDARDKLGWALEAAAELVFNPYKVRDMDKMELVSKIYSNIEEVRDALYNEEIEMSSEYEDLETTP